MDRPRMWKYIGLIRCSDCMVAVQYEIASLDGDVGEADEGQLMMAVVDAVHEGGLGIHRIRALGRPYVVSAYKVQEHPMQARQWMGSH